MYRLALIAAIAENNAIGFENKLIYWLPNDLKRFKALTTGHTIIMGSNTFRSLPKGALPNRRNVVLSRTSKEFPGAETYASLEEALATCASEETVYIIGGETLYKEAIAKADILCLTEVHDTPGKADAFFPDFNRTEWSIAEEERFPIDDKHEHEYSFVTYTRKP
jgi:dihydrofolate reductase